MIGTALQRRMHRVNNDAETRAIIYDGASVNQLATMFGMNNTEVAKRLRRLAPVGVRSGYPVYSVKEAAENLVTPKVDVENYIRRMGVKDFPPNLQKDLWAAMNGQLKFEEAQGRLWRTERVQEVWAEWHKQVRMTLLLAPDEAERDGVMSPAFYEWFRLFIDRLLRSLHENINATLEKMPALSSGIVEQDDEAEVYDDERTDSRDDDAQAFEDDDEPI